MANVEVSFHAGIVRARYRGKMTMELVREGEEKIEAVIARVPTASILYDCVEMEPPEMSLALEMKSFDSRIRDRIRRAATVVKDPMTAFMSKVAFALRREHKVFYQDLEAALAWLSDGATRRENLAPTS